MQELELELTSYLLFRGSTLIGFERSLIGMIFGCSTTWGTFNAQRPGSRANVPPRTYRHPRGSSKTRLTGASFHWLAIDFVKMLINIH